MEIPWFRLVLAVLATWRLTHLFVYEDGPGDVLAKLRERLGSGVLGQLLDCFQCLSLWVAAPLALVLSRGLVEWGLTWLALSGGACLLERLTRERVTIQELPGTEGAADGVLREEANRRAGPGTQNQPARSPESGIIDEAR